MDRVGRRLPRLLVAAMLVVGASLFRTAPARAASNATASGQALASYASTRLLSAQVGAGFGGLIAPAATALVWVAAIARGSDAEIAGAGRAGLQQAAFAIDRAGIVIGGSPAHSFFFGPSFGMSLYRPSAWSRQATNSWCVGASIQMMLNLATGDSDRGASRQGSYESYAYVHSRYRAWIGAEADGWANALTYYGAGSYSVGAYATFDAATKAAVTRMRLTGKPVGLVAMDGRHAWVMAGFTATGDDPAVSQAFEVASVTIMAPFAGSIAYDPAPGAEVSLSYLATKLTPYRDDYPTIWDGKYVIIEP
jgi:hypothetical protein